MSYGNAWQSEDIRRLTARLDDLCRQAERGEAACSAYLTPREAKYAAAHLSARLRAGTALLWGGYDGAERVRAILLPDYTEGITDVEALGADPVTVLSETGLEDLAIKEALLRLNDREKKILRLRFFEGRTQMEVAREIGISQAQVSRLEKNALVHMRKYVDD